MASNPTRVPRSAPQPCRSGPRAVEQTKSLDRKTVAEAIRGKTIKGTVFGDAAFLPNGQMQPRYVVFRVVDGKTAKPEPVPQN